MTFPQLDPFYEVREWFTFSQEVVHEGGPAAEEPLVKAVAAVVMIGGTEILRELSFLKAVFGPDFTPELYRMLLFGLAMVIVMVWKPRGFVASRQPTAFLKERKAVAGSFTKEGHG